jgi:hypothetical protein
MKKQTKTKKRTKSQPNVSKAGANITKGEEIACRSPRLPVLLRTSSRRYSPILL